MKPKKKEILTEEELQQKTREKTAQQWIPIADIDNNMIYRKDQHIVGILRVMPENLELLSEREKTRIIDSLTEGINGETEGLQIFCIGRPVDLNDYLKWLQDKAKMEQDFIRKTVLKGYIQQASQLATGGETTERRFYFIINKKDGNKAEIELLNRLKSLIKKLQDAELTASACSDDEAMDVLSLFANPVQAAYEETEVRYDFPTILKR